MTLCAFGAGLVLGVFITALAVALWAACAAGGRADERMGVE
jgi:hypothetical protein